MVHPSEIVYWELLPAVRRELVFSLKELGLKQAQIAEKLNVTASAISQYLNNKRGHEFHFTVEFKKLIEDSAKKIVDEISTAFKETNFLIKEFERHKEICKICRHKNDMRDEDCGVCFR